MNRYSRATVPFALLFMGVAFAASAHSDFSLFGKKQPNVVVVLMDTLRSDHLGAYGYERNTSPHMDGMARRGLLFTTSYSVSNWTNPAVKSMFSGLSPQSVMRPAHHEDAIRMPLPQEVVTFAELFAEEGYRTAALMDHPGLGGPGYSQGFERFSMMYKDGSVSGKAWDKSPVDFVVDRFAGLLDEFEAQPFLVYVHVVYPHRRYQAPPPFKGAFGPDDYERHGRAEKAAMINAYDAEILRTDDMVRRLEAALTERDLAEDTWIVLTSDHGEAFWEHDLSEHGNAFFDEAIRVPLIILPPEGRRNPARIDAPVSNLDVFPTILDIAGIDIPEGTMGLSLKDAKSPGRNQVQRVLFSESPHSMDIEARAVIRDGIKYVSYPNIRNVLHELYDLKNDPGEFDNLYGEKPSLAAPLQKLLAEHMEQSEIEREWLAQKLVEPDEATLEGLRSLGYIQ
jgi:arylsulfatase A-like enzyme